MSSRGPSPRSRKHPRDKDVARDQERPTRTFSSFFNDPDADVILRSSDGLLFATRETHLSSASSVLEAMFKNRRPCEMVGRARYLGQAAPRALPVVQLAEDGFRLEHFLRWANPISLEEALKGMGLYEIMETGILECAKKYDARGVFAIVFALAQSWVAAVPENVLAVGVIYGNKDLTTSAVTHWLSSMDTVTGLNESEGSSAYNIRTDTLHPDYVPCSLHNIWHIFYGQLPVGFSYHISMAQSHMLFHKDFEVDELVDYFLSAFDKDFAVDGNST